jgi:hypothetical protein
MNKLSLTNNLINVNKPILTVKELLNIINYQYNTIFIDKFWQNIKDDVWLYIDDHMLKYIGYNRLENKKNKQDYLNILKENFDIDIDYKLLFAKQFQEFSKSYKLTLRNEYINDHNKVKHLIVSPDCFKQSLMLLRTKKATEIKKYYIELEKIFKFYLEYQNKYHELELDNKNQELDNKNQELKEKENIINEQKEELDNLINIQQKTVKELKKDEYVYIATNKLNSKNNVFKIGKTLSLNGRLSNFNVNSLLDNEFYYTFLTKCNNSKMLECLIHNFLSPFVYKNELFQLHYKPLSNIVKEISIQYDIMTNMVNNYIKENYINDLNLKSIVPDKFEHTDFNLDDDNLINNIIDKEQDNSIETKYTDSQIDSMNIENNIYEYNDVKLYICPRNCEFISKQRSIMRDHLARVNKCQLINQNKELNEEYINYLINKNDIKFYVCKYCNKYFISDSKLNRHLYGQESCKQEYKCEKCNAIFRLKGDYNVHIRNIYCLDNDGNIIDSKKNIENNINTEINEIDNNVIITNGVKFYKCLDCNKIYNNKQALNYHKNRKIKCTEIFKCNKCNKEFHTIENLRKHENKKINCINEKFECNKCNKIFSCNRNLLKHLKNVICN